MKQLRIVFILCLLILFSGQMFTLDNSTVKRKYKAAESLEIQNKYSEAVPLLKELVELDPDNANFNYKLADALIESNSTENTIPYLEKAVKNTVKKYVSNYKQQSAPFDAIKILAHEYHLQYKFAEAIKTYNDYKNTVGKLNEASTNYIDQQIAYCNSGLELMKSPVKIERADFGPQHAINFPAHSPVLSPDESIYIFAASSIFFDSTNTKVAPNDDIYYIYLENGVWSKPTPLTNLNTPNNEAPISISPDGKQLIMYRDDNGDGNLYYSDLLEGSVWSKPRKFPSPINSSAQETHATISADGNKIYFTSDRKGGYGGLDIYVCTKQENGSWGKAINLGATVNTKYNEESPHLQSNSDILYFSSDRPESMGGLDIFRCRLLSDSDAESVQNLGYPINSPDNDMFFKSSLDGARGYFSSVSRKDKDYLNLQLVHFLDIRLFPNVIVRGLIIDTNHKTLKNIVVKLFDIGKREIVDSGTTNQADGYYRFKLNSERRYFASFEKDEYVYFSKPFAIEKYFANLSYSNVITLEPFMISDSSFRQEMSTFVTYQSKLRKGKISNQDIALTKSLSDTALALADPSTLDLITILDRQKPSAAITRIVNTIQSSQNSYLPPKVAPKPAPEPVVAKAPIVKDTIKHLAFIKKIVIKSSPDDRTIADSLMRLGIKQYNGEKYATSIETLEKARDIFAKLGTAKEQIICYNYIANALDKLGEYDQSLAAHKKSLALIQTLKSRKQEGDKFLDIGDVYVDITDRSEALENYYKALSIKRELKDKPGEIVVLNRIASLNYNKNNYDQALEYLLNALKLNAKDDRMQASLYNLIGLAYQGKHQYDSAVANFNRATAIADRMGDKRNKSIYLNNTGNAYFDYKNFAKALDFYNKSVAIKREINYEEGLAISLHNIGSVYKAENNNKSAINYFGESNEICFKNKFDNIAMKNHFGLMQVYKSMAVYDLALVHLEKYISLRAPYIIDGQDQQICQHDTKYAVGTEDLLSMKNMMHKQNALALLELERKTREIQLLQNQQKVQMLVRSIIFGALAASSVLLVLLIGQYRSKRKHYKLLALKNKEISEKNERITTQKIHLGELNILLSKLSIVASETGNAVAIFDKVGNYEWINKGYRSIYGFAMEELNTSPTMSILDRINEQAVRERIADVVEKNEHVSFDIFKKKKDNTSMWVKMSLTPVIIDNSLYKVISIESDINEVKLAEEEIKKQKTEIELQRNEIEKQRDIALNQKVEIQEKKNSLETTIAELQKTQKKLVESEKMASLGNLVAGISHEINTPVGIGIAAITTLNSKTKAINELFAEKKMKQSDLISYIETAKSASKLIQTHLNRTGELVKSFKRISVDEMTEALRVFDLNQYLNDIVNSLNPKINEKDVDVSINCIGEIEMNSYPGAFAQIFTNLIINSLMHGFEDRDGGIITITCKQIGTMLKVLYHDNGNGMTPEVVEKVFNPFFTTNMQTGTGLGMNSVYNIINQKLKGEIFCTSEINQGATFTIECPVSLQTEERTHLRIVS